MKTKIGYSLMALVLSLLPTVAGASVLIDPLDSIGNWNTGGGSNATDLSLTVDTDTSSQGTGSLKLQSTFLGTNFAYADVYNELSSAMDFSAETFQLDFRTNNTDVVFLWRLATQEGPVYEASYKPTTANAWETITLSASSFTGNPANLQHVTLIQLRVIGDGFSDFPATVETHFDNLQIIPEPMTPAMLGAGGLLAFIGWRRRKDLRWAKQARLLLVPSLFLSAALSHAIAETTIDLGTGVTEEKGSKVAESVWKLEDTTPQALKWKVTTSRSEEFDFARLTFPAVAEVTAASKVVLHGELTLPPDHFLDITLETEDGKLLFFAITAAEPDVTDYRLPLDRFSTNDGSAAHFPITIKAVKLMFSGDKSAESGECQMLLQKFAIE